jgi:hypothetical protein
MGLQNNTPKSIDMRNQLSILQLQLQDTTAGTAECFVIKTKIRNLEKVLLAYKSPEYEYALYCN